jgi:hypothetical protein
VDESFARKWGVVELCQHDQPWTHAVMMHRSMPGEDICGLREVESQPDETSQVQWDYWEPLAVWRAISANAGEILARARRLHDEGPLVSKDWHLLARDAKIVEFRYLP